MKTQREQIGALIESAGWVTVLIASDEWWVREMWEVRRGNRKSFVTFLVDPADMDEVWAVLATEEIPADYAGEPPRYVLPFDRFGDQLDEFFSFLETALRN